jgi:DNA polymerase
MERKAASRSGKPKVEDSVYSVISVDRASLVEHLKFFEQLGVEGISRDPVWRRRPNTLAWAEAEARGESSSEEGVRYSPPASGTVGPGIIPADSRAAGPGFSPATPGAPGGSRRILTMLREEIGPACTRCKLHALGRRQVVFGVGHPDADLMFVGEAPGADEDLQGEPFVGRAGQLLTKIIEAIGLKREQVYIANIIKCRPPGNRNPEPDEVEQCEPFLFQQVAAIKPKVIVALGKFAAQSLLRTTDPITRLRGRSFNYRGATLIPTFHPAYLLRNPSAKREVWDDMKKVRAILQGTE